MANFKLGANAITAAYLGTQGVCIINDGADTVFDAACGAQFTVTHTVSNGIGGTTNGYTISTSPGTTFTGVPGDPYSFTTTVSLNSNYQWVNGITPTISPTQPITGVVGSANSTVTTTLSNATVETIPANVVRAQLNLNYSSIVGAAVNVGYTVTGDPDGDIQTGTNSLTYSFNSGTQLVSGYEWVGNPPSNAVANGTTTTPGTTPITASFGSATIQLIQYSVTQNLTNNVGGPSAGYNLTWDGTANYNNSGTRSESGTLGQSYTFSASSLSVNSGYEETSALSLSGGGVVNGTFGTGATSYQTTASGTVAVESPNSISLGPTGTCANAACINSSPSTNWYYFGSLSAATLWSNSDGVSGSNPSNGYYNNGSSALLYNGGVISISNSCQSFVSYTGLGNGGTSTSACTDSQNDFFYITGGQLQTAQGVWNDSTACNGAGNDYYSDGVNWAYTGGSGIITNSGTC